VARNVPWLLLGLLNAVRVGIGPWWPGCLGWNAFWWVRTGLNVEAGGRMRFGDVEIRPLGGGVGCLMMLLVSVIASVVLTILLNLLL
jgi:hypothetical protein